jgi:hypothetical protein
VDQQLPRFCDKAMQPGPPSLAALGAARLRAAHQLLDGASILVDPLALRILGEGDAAR